MTDSTIVPAPYGLSLQPWDDPNGNGQEAYQLIFRNLDGSLSHSNVFVFRHGGQKLKLRVANAPSDADAAFEVVDGKVAVDI